VSRAGPAPSTFSIVARADDSGDLGVAVQSKFLAVGAVVPWARASVGAIATQAWANTSFGPEGLRMLEAGLDAEAALGRLVAADEGASHRQCGLVDARGSAVAHTGAACPDWAGHRLGGGYACQGNILAGAGVVDAMAEAFERAADRPLWERLLAALAAGQDAGGDRRGQQSAALLVVRAEGGYGGRNDRFIDLRVDDHPRPIEELGRLLQLHALHNFRSERTLAIDAPLAREVQRLLRRAGTYDGPVSGIYDPPTRSALRALVGVENLEERWQDDDQLDPVVLDFLRRRFPERGSGE
jgi:uncharacterized Ntn-hydrolase superfamily protein